MNAMQDAAAVDTDDDTRWSVAGAFLDALARRDFAAMEACLDPSIRMRGLVPRGPLAAEGAAETIAYLRSWFGRHDMFEVVDAAIGQIGERLYLRWRVMRGDSGDPDSVQVVEQHVFAAAGRQIESMDLLCSGFHVGHIQLS